MSAAIDALMETKFFDNSGDPVLPTPVKRPANPTRSTETRRLTTDIPADLHTRMKVECARHGLTINEQIRALLESRFPR